MKNQDVADRFAEIADLMDLLGEETFRVLSYRRAARALEALVEDVEDLVLRGQLDRVPGVGRALAEKIAEYLRDGTIRHLEDLRTKVPGGVVQLMEIPGVGPKTARVLWQRLGATNLAELERTVRAGGLRKIKGFGAKKEEAILRGIRLRAEAATRRLLAEVLPLAESTVEYLRAHAPVDRIAFAGSVRRMRETVGDLDVLATTSEPRRVSETFVSMTGVQRVVLAGDTKATVLLEDGFQIDLRILSPKSWGAGLQYFTGSKDHNVKLRGLAASRGLKLNEYGLFDETGRSVAGETEEGIYEALDLQSIPPELREDAGEIEAARDRAIPALLEPGDVGGEFHVHTNRSDGREPPEVMIEAARSLGYAFVGISDHSRSLQVAHGLSIEDLREHKHRLHEMERRAGGIRVLVGTECDILEDGSMDYPDEVLRELDFAIASVHSRFSMARDPMTERVIRAVENPYVNILGHPTARLIGRRDPIRIDLERVFEACARTGTALELNAQPDRMDLNGDQARLAKRLGAKFVIDTDSHARHELGNMRLGVGTARRAWLRPEDVVNTWPVDDIVDFFR